MPLHLSSVALEGGDFDIFEHLPTNPMTYIRGGQGIVGWGEAVRLEARGANRIADLAAQWSRLVDDAVVEDAVRLPGSGLVAFGSIAFADQSQAASVLIVPKVLLGVRDGRVWLTRVADYDGPEFWASKQEFDANPSVTLTAGSQSADGFKQSVAQAVEAIKSGKLEKTVLARDIEGQLPNGFDLRATLARLAKRFDTCWIYSVDGMFGASPELLVRVAHGQVSARVLAGTAARGTDREVDAAIAAALATSPKNTNEHAFAVDSLVQTLKPFCEHVDADPKPFSLALPNLWHLASDVHGVLKRSASVLDLADALHPTAAVAGTPRLEAQQLIGQLEPFDRARYAGPIGWIGADGDGEWAIALRGAQIEGQTVRAFAGCGIVVESEPEAELAETELKFSPMREALG